MAPPNNFSVPKDFLTGPPPTPTVQKVDFTALDLPEYAFHYAILIDNAFSASECQQLLTLVESSTDGVWERAMVNVGNNSQQMMSDIRNCDRIIWDSAPVVSRIWARVRPHVEADIGLVRDNARVTGWGPVKRKEVAVATRLNERMRFLKYGPGEFFREHQDGQYRTPDNSEFSLYTLHLYLNENDPRSGNRLVGGATTFFDPRFEGREASIEPRTGRVLVFQHRGLVHSGEEVVGGLKMTMRTDVMFRKESAEERGERERKEKENEKEREQKGGVGE